MHLPPPSPPVAPLWGTGSPSIISPYIKSQNRVQRIIASGHNHSQSTIRFSIMPAMYVDLDEWLNESHIVVAHAVSLTIPTLPDTTS